MRRSRVNSTLALASAAAGAAAGAASIATPTLAPSPHTECSQTRSDSQSQSPGLRLFRLLAVVSLIAAQLHCVLGTTTSAALSTVVSSEYSETENNFYFDEHNRNKTVSFNAAETAEATANVTAQMPVETIPRSSDGTRSGVILLTTARSVAAGASMRVEASGGNLTTIKYDSIASIDLLPTGLATAAATSTSTTTKSVRSTASKQPNDLLKSRNHWGAGGPTDAERSRTFRNKFHHENHYGPFFEEPSNSVDPGKTLISAVHLFTEAVLNCRVGMLKDKTVMWVRRTTEKVSLLTVGNVTYSGDPRIRVKFQYPNNWRLMINPTQQEDAGVYMCQVSTHPPRVFTTNLTILEPPLRIIDENERDVGDRYYKSGSTVDLQCQISHNFYLKEFNSIAKSLELSSSITKQKDGGNELNLVSVANHTSPSQKLDKDFNDYITWAKDEEPLQALTNRRSSISDKWLSSRISIPDAKLADSGNYSCSLGRLFTVIVQVQVLTGELPAAVQHNLARRSASCLLSSWSLLIIVICFYVLTSHSPQFHSIKQIMMNV